MDSNWKGYRIISPAGEWYLMRNREEALKATKGKRATGDGENKSRAVFYREELRNIMPQIKQISDGQSWLSDIITIKSALGMATITSLKITK